MSQQESSWPKLYGLTSTGKIKTWRIWVESSREIAYIYTEYGEDEGKLQKSKVVITEGKNIGRGNSTTPYTQACSEASSKWKKKKDAQYVEDRAMLEKAPSISLPMLAHSYKKKKKYVTWPAFVQPKLDGIRCLALKVSEYKIEYTSRKGKYLTTLDHLTGVLLGLMKVGEIFDGELYLKGLSLQKISAAVKRDEPNDSTRMLEYWVYDCVQLAHFRDRTKYLQETLAGLPKDSPIIPVPTRLVKTEKAMERMHDQMIKAGYEGAMVRNITGLYVCKHRNVNLLKVKNFEDAEFDTVRYQYFTDDGIPFLPTGIAIRDYE